MAKESLEVEIAGRKVATSFYNWLAEEVETSVTDNASLDDFKEARRRLGLDYEGTENWAAEKQKGHLNRVDVKFWPLYESDPEDDEFSAQVLFGAMMFTSGAYRIQSYLQAKSPEEYNNRRRRAAGINLYQVVTGRLATLLPASGNFSRADISVASYEGLTLEQSKTEVMQKIGETTVRNVARRVSEGHDLGEESSPSLDEMLKAQKSWIEFATDCVTVAAKLRRGDLSAVPFLEPKSISAQPSPKVIYPLALGSTG